LRANREDEEEEGKQRGGGGPERLKALASIDLTDSS
jgi:hypothetical protein